MTPDNPFLQALLAEPDDDTLRLALADWLDENDQPARAEFIRVQVELAHSAPDPDRWQFLDQRQNELLLAHGGEWVAPLGFDAGAIHSRLEFRRGFVECFRLSVGVLIRDGARLARLTPVRELHVVRGGAPYGELRDLWRQPWLRSVTHLYGVELSDWSAPALLASPYLTGLRVLQSRWSHLEKPLRRQVVQRFGHALPPG